MADPRDVERPFAPPDHSDPAARDTLRVTPPPRRGDRVAVFLRHDVKPSRARRSRGALVERIGSVGVVHDNGTATVILDETAREPRTMRTVPFAELHPRAGR